MASAGSRLWKPEELWPLPENPYVAPPLATPHLLLHALQLVLVLLLFPLRLVLVLVPSALPETAPRARRPTLTRLSVFLSWLTALVSVAGWPRGTNLRADKPLPPYGWRRLLQRAVIPLSVRLNLLALGYWPGCIRIIGKQARRADAPIIVANHQSFVDIWFFLWQCLPVGVSAAENLRFPVMGTIQASQQTIFVEREDRGSGSRAAELISAIARDDRWPRLAIYPEGNTSNGRQLCGFKAGAFAPGLPVQPLVISYGGNPYAHPAWVEPLGLPLPSVVLSLLFQPINFMTARWLPPLTPTAEEVKQPALFAARVKARMASALAIPSTECSFADTRLFFAARKLKLPPAIALLEMDKATRLWGVGFADCREVLERFAAGGGPGATSLSPKQLAQALRLDGAGLGEETVQAVAATFRQGGAAEGVTFREMVAGLAPLARAAKAKGGAAGSFVELAVQELLGRVK